MIHCRGVTGDLNNQNLAHFKFSCKLMEKAKKMTSFHLSSLLRLQKDPVLALNLFLNPNPNPNSNPKPFRYSLLCYDLIITKLGRAKMFQQMEQIIEMLKHETRFVPREIIFCNIINFYARARLPERALAIFDQIPCFRCERTIKSVNTVLNALLNCREFGKIRGFLVGIRKYGDPDVCTYNILINAACVSGDLDSAWKVFVEMSKRGLRPNEFTFGTLINGQCANSRLDEAIKLKNTMFIDFNVKPTAFIYAALIKGLCTTNKLSDAFVLKNEMLKSRVVLNSASYASLIIALFKAGRRGDAIGLVGELRENECKIDIVTYNAIISGFCLENDLDAAFRALNEMGDEGCSPDVITYNIIIGGLCREGRLEEAMNLLENMSKNECLPDIVTYRILFDGFCDRRQHKGAAVILDKMVLKGYAPRSESLTKYVVRLSEDGELKLLWSIISSMGKGNLIDAITWKLVVPLVCQNSDHLKGLKFVNTLAMS